MATLFQEQKRKTAASISSSSVLQIHGAVGLKKSNQGTVFGVTHNGTITVKERLLVSHDEENKVQTEEYHVNFLASEELPNGAVVIDADQDKEQLKQSRERILKGKKTRTDYVVRLKEKSSSSW